MARSFPRVLRTQEAENRQEMGEFVSIHPEAVTIARAMMASSQTKDHVNWWIASLNLAMRPEGASVGHGFGAYVGKFGEGWLSIAIAEMMMVSINIKHAVNRFVLDRKMNGQGFSDDEDLWCSIAIAKAMAVDPKVRDRVQCWIDARVEKSAEIRRESNKRRLAKARLNPTAFENVKSHWMRQSLRRKRERDSSVEFIVMREYRREISELRRIENLTIHKSPCFRSHVNRKRHERNKVRKIEEPEFRIHMSCRRRVNAFVRGKSMRTQDLVGCSWSDYRLWLESKFKAGMSWDNYGEWEIDHIVPCVSFDLTKDDQLYKCFHYSNTQPLWKSENGKKGSRINGAWIRRVGKRLAFKESF